MSGEGWEPGDPIHRNPNVAHQTGLFSIRGDNFDSWTDAATWPNPAGRRLPDGDELGDLIAWHHTQRDAAAS